jgi:MSHA biogenesis protein MshJ
MTNDLRIKYQALEEKAHKLSVRERLIIVGAVAVLLLGIFDQLLLRPWLQERQQIEQDKSALLKSMETSNRRIDELQQAILNNPNNQLKASIENLLVLHAQVDQGIAKITDGMIAPQKMPVILGEMLSERFGLKVQSVKSKAAERLMVADEHDQHAAAIYRHDLELKMVGSFFQMKDYLAAVEGLPDKLLWDHLEYVVEEYPKGSLTLEVHTLSSQEELLRVAQ